jgi:hypothetical protein
LDRAARGQSAAFSPSRRSNLLRAKSQPSQKRAGKVVCQAEIETAGSAARLKLTPRTGPDGLIADGSDVVLVDVEVVDSKGAAARRMKAAWDF